MANRILVSAEENFSGIEWIGKVDVFAQKVLEKMNIDGEEISILFCGDSFIQKLNSDYRNINAPTDVLSFENGSEYTDEQGKSWLEAGDIAISLETLPKNAAYFEVDEDEELKRLIIHGILHLNGYDHGEEHVEKGKEPECEMLKIQKNLMSEFCSEHILR